MKVTVLQSELSDALRRLDLLNKGAASVSSINYCRMEAKENSVFLYGFDLEKRAWIRINADIDEEGELFTHTRRTFGVVRAITENMVQIESHGEKGVRVTSGKSNYNLYGISKEDAHDNFYFDAPDKGEISISAGTFSKLLTLGGYAYGDEKTRKELSTVCISCQDGVLTAITGEGGARAVIATIPVNSEESFTKTLHHSYIDMASRTLDGVQGNVSLSVTNSEIWCKCTDLAFSSRFMEFAYPIDAIKALVASNPQDITFYVGKEVLSGICNRLRAIAEQKSPKIDLAVSETLVDVTSASGDGEALESFDVSGAGNGRLRIRLEHLEDAFGACPSGVIGVSFIDSTHGLRLFVPEEEASSISYVAFLGTYKISPTKT